MTMPKKGTRKIVVNNKTYRYTIKHSCTCDYWCECYSPEDRYLRVVIETPDGIATAYEFQHERYNAFTPKDVRELIEKENI